MRPYLIAPILFFFLLGSPLLKPSEAILQEDLETEFNFLEKERSDVAKESISALKTVEVKVVNKVLEDRRRIKEKQNKAWAETLEINKASFTHRELKRRELKSKIAIYTEHIDATTIDEIKEGLGVALAIADHDKLDVKKMLDIYNEMKELIRTMKHIDLWSESVETDVMSDEIELYNTLNSFYSPFARKIKPSDFELPRQIVEGLDHKLKNLDDRQLSTRLVNLFFIVYPYEGEMKRAENALDRQEIRVRLYKRSSLAFMRALISGMDPRKPCIAENQRPMVIEINGQKIPSFGCPDPVVENLWKYHNAISKIKTAESYRLQAKIEMIIGEQQFVGDLISLIPVVGDAVDFSYVVFGEDINGVTLTTGQRIIMGLAAALPVVGPGAFKQAMKRSTKFKNTMIYFSKSFTYWKDTYYLMGRELFYLADDIGEYGIKELAQKFSMKPDELKKLFKFMDDNPFELDDAARARMKAWQTVTDAANNKLTTVVYKKIISELPKTEAEILAKTMARAASRSKTILDTNLMARQGTRAEVIAESNMVGSHVDAFEEVVKKPGKRKIVLIRPVSADATPLLKANKASPKPFTVKPKSSDWGVAKGHIPVEQKFSKLGNPAGNMDADAIAEFSEKSIKAQKTIKHVPLTKQFDEFGDEVLEATIVKKGNKEIVVLKRPSGELIDPDTLKPLNMKNIDLTNQRALRVFADKNGIPYTADYDLLDIGHQSPGKPPFFPKLEGDTVTWREGHGASTDRIDAAIKELNEGGVNAGYTKGDLVQHAPERYNPNTKGIDFRPPSEGMPAMHVTAIDPDYGPLNIPFCDGDCMRTWCRTTGMCDPSSICPPGKILNCILPDKDRLIKDYYHNAKMRGIDLTPNEAWGWGRHNKLGGWTMTGYQGGLPASFNVAKGQASFAQKVIIHLQGKLVGKAYNSLFGRLMRLQGYYDIKCKGTTTNCTYYGK
ncbi:MAG: anthrax toxin-like adenylyl cyclase domain-containing protein [Thermodesulfobacteriota bacterium]